MKTDYWIMNTWNEIKWSWMFVFVASATSWTQLILDTRMCRGSLWVFISGMAVYLPCDWMLCRAWIYNISILSPLGDDVPKIDAGRTSHNTHEHARLRRVHAKTYEIKMFGGESTTGRGDDYISWEWGVERMRGASEGVEGGRLDNLGGEKRKWFYIQENSH